MMNKQSKRDWHYLKKQILRGTTDNIYMYVNSSADKLKFKMGSNSNLLAFM